MQFEFIELGLWVITLILMGILASDCFYMWRQNESIYYIGLTCFFSLFTVGYTCSLINTYFFGFDFASMSSSYLLFNPAWLLFRSLFIVCAFSGVTIYQYALNKEVLDTKGIFIPFYFIIMIISLVNYLIPTELVYYNIPLVLSLFSIPAIYFYLAKKSAGAIRINSFLIGLGILWIEMGTLLALPEAWLLFHWPPLFMRIFAPVFMSVGIIIFLIGERRSRKK